MSLWPFKSSGGRIQDLKPPELAAAATLILQKRGRNPLSSRLIYRALELNPFEPQALLMLSEIYRSKTKVGRPTGDEVYSGLVIEFAMDERSPFSHEQKRPFDKARAEIMTAWGFSKTKGQELEIDHLGYMEFINELVSQVRSIQGGFQYAHVKLGIQAGLLDSVKGTPTKSYQEWLHSDAAILQH